MRYSRTGKRIRSLSDWPTMLLTFAVCLLCWIMGFNYSIGFPMVKEYSVLPLWEWVCTSFNSKFFVYIVGILFVVLSGYVIQRTSDIEMLIRERTRMPVLIFMLFVSTNTMAFAFQEVSVVLLCLVFMVRELVQSYQLPEATGRFFNAGVLIGIAGLFMPQVFWFIPLLWLGMYQFRSLTLKSWLASLVGLFIIYWFVFAWCLWKHDYSIFTSLFATWADFHFFSMTASFQYYQIGFLIILLLLIVSLVQLKMDAFNNSVRVRQMHAFLLNMSVWSLFLIILYGHAADSFVAVLYLPGTVAITYLLENMRYRIRFLLYYFILALSLVSFIMRVWNL